MKPVHLSARERRYFPRINYRAYATLVTTSQRWQVHIMDLSFNGALAALIHKHNLQNGEELILTISLDDGPGIKMQGHLSHQKEHFLGIECRATNIDSQILLRDLLEKYKEDDRPPDRSLKTMILQHEEESTGLRP